MVSGDVAAVAGILTQCPEAAQWSAPVAAPVTAPFIEHDSGADTPSSTRVLVATPEQNSEIAGMIVVRTAAGEAEVLNLAVLPACRRRGLASGLVQAALALARSAGAHHAFLEVRESNVGARAFYGEMGFTEAGRRRAYYRSPVEDALILSRSLD
jgi:ribosomal-protein-alanine N-acetyltransferase